MSHEIYSNDTVVLGSNKPAWHNLGKVFNGLLSPLRVYAEGVGAVSMEETAVYSETGDKVDGYKTIVGNYSNGARTALSVVGDGYGLIPDSSFFEILHKVYYGRACVETAGTLGNGRKIWALIKRKNYTLNFDLCESFDLWVNRHDGSGCFELHRTNIRVVCQNTWNSAIGSGRNRVFGVRHTVNIKDNIARAINLVETVDRSDYDEETKLLAMVSARMTSSESQNFFKKLLNINEERYLQPNGDTVIDGKQGNDLFTLHELFMRGTGNSGQTRFDAFNAVTEFVDHHRTVRTSGNKSRSEARFESLLLGSGDALKAKAFELLTVN